MGLWDWLTGKKDTDKAEGYLQNSVDLTKQTTGDINNQYSNLRGLLTSNIGSNVNNLNNLSNSLLSHMDQYSGGANSSYLNQVDSDIDKSFDKQTENQNSKLANMGFNPNDSAFNSANAEMQAHRASTINIANQQAQNQAYQNFMQGANMYGALQQNGINQGMNATNSWASALNSGLTQNIGANNALSALYNNKAGSNLRSILDIGNTVANIGGAIAKGVVAGA